MGQRFIKKIFAGAVGCATLFLFLTETSHYQSLRTARFLSAVEDSEQQEEEQPRPIIYTYYQKAGQTMMTDDGDANLLEAWKSAWYDAGFEPKILNQTHAEVLPEYNELMAKLDTEFTGAYNTQCFIRWMAMAANGGGWMADYDTFPLHKFAQDALTLPNDGNMTGFDGFIPSLVAGSGEEYLRVARRMADLFKEHDDKKEFYSDMLALQDIRQDEPTSIQGDETLVVIAERLEGTGIDPVVGLDDCRRTLGMRAIHFSHHSIYQFIRKAKEDGKEIPQLDDRGEIARNFLREWNEKCVVTSAQ